MSGLLAATDVLEIHISKHHLSPAMSSVHGYLVGHAMRMFQTRRGRLGPAGLCGERDRYVELGGNLGEALLDPKLPGVELFRGYGLPSS